MTDRQRRAVLYARKSTKQDRSQERSGSVTTQLEECRRYAEAQGWVVVDEFADDGKSGLWERARRPGLDKVLTMLERKEADTLVVYWKSRLSRDELERATILRLMETLRVQWHAIMDGGLVDRSTFGGYVKDKADEMIDGGHSIRVKENWRTAHKARIEKGLPKTTAHRFGYRYDFDLLPDSGRKVNGRYVIHEEEAEVVHELYRRYTRGEGFTQLVRWLNSEGWRVAGTGKQAGQNNRWTVRTLNRFMDFGFAAGFISRETEDWQGNNLRDTTRGSHQTIISETEWLAYRAEREKRAPLGKAASARDRWWLGGFVKCAACSGSTYVDSFKRPDGKSSVMCSTHRADPDSCKGVTILRAYVESAVGLWLVGHLDRLDALATDEAKATAEGAALVFKEAVAARDKIVDGLADLEVSNALGGIQPAAFNRAKTKLTARLKVAEAAVTSAASDLHAPKADTSLLRSAANDGWTPDQRAALRSVLDRVEIGKDALTILPVTGEPVTLTRSAMHPRCKVDGCDRRERTKGLCTSHTMRARNLGILDELAARVAESVEAPGPTVTVEQVDEVLAEVAARRAQADSAAC